ncbi:MAG TPA: phage portal protein, partial [Pseudomonadales bacterium]|nr:phage portal protein [Pseudomonadales bacterium]
MAFWDRFLIQAPKQSSEVKAQYAPVIMGDDFGYFNTQLLTKVSRDVAMSLPAIIRCRNLIAGTIGSIPLHLYRKSNDQRIGSPKWLDQPSIHQPRSVTLAYTVDSLLFYGVAYWQVVEQFQDDGRPARFNWIAPTRVTQQVSPDNQFVTQYYIDGAPVPMDGIGSLITFQGLSEGILNTGATIIQQAYRVQKAAYDAATSPTPTGIIKNTGADLSENEVAALLAQWKSARQRGTTAYLTSTLDYMPSQFSPKDMGYVDLIQNLTTQIARLCNIPAYYLSADENNSMTYANVQDERKQLIALALQPYITAIETRLSMDDMTNTQNYVRFAIDDTFLRADTMAR